MEFAFFCYIICLFSALIIDSAHSRIILPLDRITETDSGFALPEVVNSFDCSSLDGPFCDFINHQSPWYSPGESGYSVVTVTDPRNLQEIFSKIIAFIKENSEEESENEMEEKQSQYAWTLEQENKERNSNSNSIVLSVINIEKEKGDDERDEKSNEK